MTQPADVLAALAVFSSGAPDKAAISSANTWLQDFQHSTEAWSTANTLLLSPQSEPSVRFFAAQTFRSKVTYDLSQIPPSDLPALRSTLLAALQSSASGPRNIITQLCLALSGLALQFPRWENPLQDLFEMFGASGDSVQVFLEWLALFPQELSENARIPVTSEEYKDRSAKLLTANASKVLELLTMYLQSPGSTLAIQTQVFNCLRAWVNSGEIAATAIGETPLLEFAFAALSSEQLFDAAVDVICDLIHETQELDENMSVIHAIVPRVIALRPMLATHKDDSEQIRGYTRIFAETGETYRVLLLQSPQDFLSIIEAIAECTAYHDLDIVPITFPFWWRLAQSIGKRSAVPPVLIDAYSALVEIIIRHLHFPADPDSMTNQEADDFRSFRHVMGDTLKDCCHVLGTDKCLTRAYEMITTALSASGGVSWQAIEAPLFSMRSMGAEMDPTDEKITPKIMDTLPNLPAHPRVRYAALLVVSRYTEWTSQHPSYIPFQLQYISAGFDDPDAEVPAAAGLAMKYLCKDCRQHLVTFLPQLHSFLNSVGDKLNQEDRLQIYEAVGYVISCMPLEEAAQSLKTFCLDILAKIHIIVNKPTLATSDELQRIGNYLEHLEAMLYIVRGFGDQLPAACQNTSQDAWVLFDNLIAKYGEHYSVGDHAARVIRYSIELFGTSSLPIMQQVLSRMATSFQATGLSGYMWIVGKVIGRFGDEEDPALREAFRQSYETVSEKVVAILHTKPPSDIPDVIEDYIRLLLQMVEFAPDLLFSSPTFLTSVITALSGLTLVQADICYLTLDFLRIVVTHDCLYPARQRAVPPKFPLYAQAIREVFAKQGFQILGFLLTGFVTDFDEDAAPIVITIFRSLSAVWPTEVASWLPTVVEQFPSAIPMNVRQQFLEDFNKAIARQDLDDVKNAAVVLHRASRRIKARRMANMK
ncbi:ARM repeat-containing protein [Hysterangium stoloniferum]|nr:ARM repeat-containing protein [Hysterangium stoloniferum]